MSGPGIGMGVAAGVAVAVGGLAAYTANRLDDDGGANKALTIASGIVGGAGLITATAVFAWASKSPDWGGVIVGSILSGGSLIAAGGALAFTTGSLGVDLLGWGQHK